MVIRFSLFRDTGFVRRRGVKGTHWFSKKAMGHRGILPTYRLVFVFGFDWPDYYQVKSCWLLLGGSGREVLA